MTIVQAPFFQNTPSGQIVYTEPGTYSFTVPDDVFFLGALCIGGGGGGSRDNNNAETGGGGGGGLRFTRYLPVNPGEILTIVVGSGGPGATSNGSGTAGGNTTISRGGTTLLQANGGGGGTITTGGTGGTGTTLGGIIGGGNGGNGGNEDNTNNTDGGGGGAGGYSGNGGVGGTNAGTGGNGTGGGGGGGGAAGTGGGGGGGVGLLGGDGTLNGTGGTGGGTNPGGGGSGGSTGSGLNGGLYGGGGGGNDGASGGNGANGAARIIWGPNRTYPSTNATNVFTGSTLLYTTSFASTNATTNGSITVPSTANGDLYLFIAYENSTTNRPTITGFTTILSDNGTFDGATSTRVLLKGRATPGSTVTIPNDATYNGFVASLIGFTNGTNLGQTIFQAGVTNVLFSSITNGYFIMMANHDGAAEAFDTYSLDADFTRTFTYLTANGAVTGRAAAIGVVEPVVQSGTITPSRPAVGATVQTQGTQFCFLYIN